MITAEQIRFVIAGNPFPTYVWQCQGDDFVLVDFNPAAEIATDGRIRDVQNICASCLYGDEPEIVTELRACFESQSHYSREMLYRFRTNGRQSHLDVTFAYLPPDYVLVHTRDLTQETRYRDLFDNTTDLVNIVYPDGRIAYVNKSWCETLGYTEAEAESLSVWDVVHPSSRKRYEGYFRRVLEGMSFPYVDATFVTKAGTPVFVEGALSCRREDEAPVAVRGIYRDVSLRRNFEMEQNISRLIAEERTQVGQQLHDVIAQQITGIKLLASTLERELEEISPDKIHTAREIGEIAQETSSQIRALIQGLSPIDVNGENFFDHLVTLGISTERVSGIPCQLDTRGVLEKLTDEECKQLYFIAREAVHNAVRHASPGAIQIRVEIGRDAVLLEIEDNGIGGLESADRTNGMGLRILHYRASEIGARLEIKPLPQGGTLIRCYRQREMQNGARFN